MKAFLATLLAAASFSTFAQGLTVDWTWKKDHNCSITSPELAIGNIPEGTKKLEVNMRDLDFRNFDHGGGIVTLYGHNSSLQVGVGQTVGQGQVIALAGSTGNSTGPHCHFEVRVHGEVVNPGGYLP